MTEVTLSTKHQIVVPREAREALQLRPGAKLQVVVRGETVILMRKPKRAARTLMGRARHPARYLEKERGAW